ncbi:MAG: MATE family efflux transporter [Stappiaceae bacterium]
MTTDRKPTAKFTQGSMMKHVVVMTMTGSVGLMAIFIVDFANLFYISLLGAQDMAAAIGYAGTILFFNIAICIGMTIATSAVVAKALGSGDRQAARRRAGVSIAFVTGITLVLVAIMMPALDALLSLLGATGRTKEIALGYLLIIVPSVPFLGVGMALSGILRAVGDAKRAMYVTLAGGLVTAALDPIFIFLLDLGVTGAAIVAILSRMTILAVGLHGAIKVHNLIGLPKVTELVSDFRALTSIAIPAVLTNIATPVGNAYITGAIAPYGDDAVAGWAVIGRIIPLIFGGIFALSGAVGPILGQNYGANQFQRVRNGLNNALIFSTVYTLVMWVLLVAASGLIVEFFGARDIGAELILFFCYYIAGSFIFMGFLFVSNAAYNNLGYPTYSTFFNWGRATLGTIPFVSIGAYLAGAQGVLAGQALGACIFGVAAIVICYKVTGRLEKHTLEGTPPVALWKHALSAFSSGKSAGL